MPFLILGRNIYILSTKSSLYSPLFLPQPVPCIFQNLEKNRKWVMEMSRKEPYLYNADYPTVIIITVSTYQILYSRHYSKCFTCVTQNIPNNPTVITPVLQKRKPWPPEVGSLGQGHLAGCGSRGRNIGSLATDPKLSITH